MSYWRMCEKCPNFALERNLYGIFYLFATLTAMDSQDKLKRPFTMRVSEPWVCSSCNSSMMQTSPSTPDYS